MKKCSQKTCSRHHDTEYKRCEVCREIARRSQKKRKRLAAQLDVPNGMQLCEKCSHFKTINDFTSKVNRREKLTAWCKSCRGILSKSIRNPDTKKGACRAFWIKWKKQQTCVDCGCNDWMVMEADHVGKKVEQLSECSYWASRGGVEAMKEELKNCQPRCRCCHQIITKKRSDLKRELEGRKQNPTNKRRRNQINQIKLKIGKCSVCNRKVTKETCVAFDFDHKDESNHEIYISQSVYKNKAVFQRTMLEEIPKCTVKCANCHHIKTNYKYKY